MRTSSLAVLALVATSVPGLSGSELVTFSEHVAPIIFKNCSTCHRPGQGAPFPLTNFEEVRKRGKFIVEVTTDRYMPPWHAATGGPPFKDERRLTDDQILTLSQWVESGMAEGDPEKVPALPDFPEGWLLGKPDMVIEMTEAYDVPADGPDIYRNFVVSLDLPEDKWLKAIDFKPSAPSVVHHSLFFIDETGDARKRDAEEDTPGFRRMPQRLERGGFIGGWALGANALMLPDGMADKLPKNADFVFSTHFHPSGKPEQEKSVAALYFSNAPPTRPYSKLQLPPLFGAVAAIDIPAGEKRYSKTDYFEVPVDVHAFAIGAHAHYLGKEMTMMATLPGGTSLQLLRVDDWDFAWQEQYAYKEFVLLPKGTRIDAEIVWDNSDENPRNPSHPPKRTKWGLESTDEMGSVTVALSAVEKADSEALETAISEHRRESALRTFLANADKSEEGRGWMQRARAMFDRDQNGKFDPEERKAIREFLKGMGL
ncbi:MAG: hypothetical protein KDN22_17125 [Verrucomicrobiae bacterium]|nr:hypothetical protein [Verrucomicrobiae bacterium]